MRVVTWLSKYSHAVSMIRMARNRSTMRQVGVVKLSSPAEGPGLGAIAASASSKQTQGAASSFSTAQMLRAIVGSNIMQTHGYEIFNANKLASNSRMQLEQKARCMHEHRRERSRKLAAIFARHSFRCKATRIPRYFLREWTTSCVDVRASPSLPKIPRAQDWPPIE